MTASTPARHFPAGPRLAAAVVLVGLFAVGALGPGRIGDPCIGPGCHRAAASVAGGEAPGAHPGCLHAPCHDRAGDTTGPLAFAVAAPAVPWPVPASRRPARRDNGRDPSVIRSRPLFRPPRPPA